MSSYDSTIEKACQNVDIPGAILVASSADGKFRYEKSFGSRSLKDPSPLKLDATMWLASCTKLLTTIAAMQCVEKGLLSLDGDIGNILPELTEKPIFKGFGDDDKPILVKRKNTMTLRHLLTHQSGVSYDVFNPDLMKYQAYVGKKPSFGGGHSIVESYDYPLLFEPGESWEYSVGIDWAGEAVMRVTNLSLEDYMKANIWGPLGIKHITFHPKQNPEVLSRLADMSERDCPLTMFGSAQERNAKLKYTSNGVWKMDSVACHGGAGGYGNPLEYQKILHSICADDGKLLQTATIDEMFKPQLTDAARAKKQWFISIPEMRAQFGVMDENFKADWGIGGIMNLEAIPGRSAGSIAWGGYPNLLWYIDRKAGMSGMIGTQICPPGDVVVGEMMMDWTAKCYKEAGVEPKEKL